MKPLRTLVSLVALALLVGGSEAARSEEDSVEEATQQFDKFIEAAAGFVKDVRFDESDVKAMLANWDEFNAIGENEEADEGDGDEEFVDFETLLAYPAYRSWAKSKGVDPELWMKKCLRIQLMTMRESLAANRQESDTQLKTQLAELEKQRAQMGEEMYQQMKKAMENAAGVMRTMSAAYEKLPEPTAAEKTLITKYRSQLEGLE